MCGRQLTLFWSTRNLIASSVLKYIYAQSIVVPIIHHCHAHGYQILKVEKRLRTISSVFSIPFRLVITPRVYLQASCSYNGRRFVGISTTSAPVRSQGEARSSG